MRDPSSEPIPARSSTTATPCVLGHQLLRAAVPVHAPPPIFSRSCLIRQMAMIDGDGLRS
ncbi:hypothetical protein RISK_000965 [Rhodopirellula islandica]|uniref:Uncharacterized protein n=1 Tax=Rhodopirellula islandica TaxID=595434 RepID=A0A0J1ENU5_RHOIS|nr:hypothetical protein RISK_000965 [Rhodopirellula islandica]